MSIGQVVSLPIFFLSGFDFVGGTSGFGVWGIGPRLAGPTVVPLRRPVILTSSDNEASNFGA